MISFLIHIAVSIFIGVCFVYLAKRYTRSEAKYFIIGFVICFLVRIIYLLIYGYFSDFQFNGNYDLHKNYSILLSLIISFIIFKRLSKRMKKQSLKSLDIDEIGK